ncbi:hypothetical protein LZ32DRAFT_617645 [Colletotrichum eremochloae]|nr:hypothetical protein LZ32DRAFT_617645 [Colletotrichum eremochloae]
MGRRPARGGIASIDLAVAEDGEWGPTDKGAWRFFWPCFSALGAWRAPSRWKELRTTYLLFLTALSINLPSLSSLPSSFGHFYTNTHHPGALAALVSEHQIKVAQLTLSSTIGPLENLAEHELIILIQSTLASTTTVPISPPGDKLS